MISPTIHKVKHCSHIFTQKTRSSKTNCDKQCGNISLAAFSNERHSKIVAQYICQEVVNTNCINGPELRLAHTDHFISWKVPVCCSVIRLLNVSRVSISGMSIELNLHGILGIIMQKSSNVHVQMNVSCTKNNHILAAMSDSDYFCHFGLLASESSHLFVDKTHAHKNLVGIGLHRTNNTIISNSKFSHSEKYGLYITNTDNISLMNTIVSKNVRYGMFLHWARNTVMENVIFTLHLDYMALFQNSTRHNRYECIYELWWFCRF